MMPMTTITAAESTAAIFSPCPGNEEKSGQEDQSQYLEEEPVAVSGSQKAPVITVGEGNRQHGHSSEHVSLLAALHNLPEGDKVEEEGNSQQILRSFGKPR